MLWFLELSSVGRRVEGGEDEDGAYTARMDDWIVTSPVKFGKLAFP
jgi:hypothetical protein